MANEGRTRIIPASVSGPVHAGDKRIFRIGLYGIGGLFVLCLLMLWAAQGHHQTAQTQSASGGRTTTATIDTVCSRIKHSVQFGSKPIRINPDAACAPDLWHDGHCLYVQRAAWTGDNHPYRHCGGALPNDVEWAWSADSPFIGAVALAPPRYNSVLARSK